MHIRLIKRGLLILIVLATQLIHHTQASEQPNIVLIMADDLGVEGIGCYGGTSYRTPSIDKLAKEGQRFTHAYAQPLCTNTRVQLMTGYYNNRNWRFFGVLDPDVKTIGHYMQAAGYKTCIAGKWQLQSYDPPSYPGSELRRGKGMKIEDAGFDQFSMYHAWHTEDKGSRYANPTLYENGKLLREIKNGYGPDHWVSFIKNFIDEEKESEQPFFIYYAMALPHRPFVPTPKSAAWKNASQRGVEDTKNFPDMVEAMDACVGKIVQHIEASGIGKNTLVIFYSDNGTHQKIVSQTTEGAVVGGKGKTTDAGTHVPLIVRWPGKVRPGVNENLVDSTDFLPTIVEAAHHPIPKGLDGISFYPQLLGRNSRVRPWVFCHYDPRPGWDKDQFRKIRFVRDRNFKLYGNGKLFDVSRDKLEQKPILPAEDSAQSRQARDRLVAVLRAMPNPDPAPRDGDPRQSEQRLYIALEDQISVFKIERDSGKPLPLQRLPLPGAGPFTIAPNRSLMYATATQDGAPALATLSIAPTGKLEIVQTAKCGLRPGYLMCDNNGEFLAGSHYREGNATIWKIDPIFKGERIVELSLEQHAHSAVFSPDNHWLLVPATSPNKIFVNQFFAQVGSVQRHQPSFVMGPSAIGDAQQPRHLVFHPNLSVAYTTNERKRPGVCVWHWDTEIGHLVPTQNLVTQPNGFAGEITTADLHLTPNGKYLFVSSRDVSRRNAVDGQDSIVGFRVDSQTGLLELLGHYACERIPRSFSIDKTGEFMYVAGQGDGKLGVYQIQEDGTLTKIDQAVVGNRPVWVETLALPTRANSLSQ